MERERLTSLSVGGECQSSMMYKSVSQRLLAYAMQCYCSCNARVDWRATQRPHAGEHCKQAQWIEQSTDRWTIYRDVWGAMCQRAVSLLSSSIPISKFVDGHACGWMHTSPRNEQDKERQLDGLAVSLTSRMVTVSCSNAVTCAGRSCLLACLLLRVSA